jgi:hypothetical protein
MLLDQREGRIQAAVRTCQDVLALGRDAATIGTVLGVNIGAADVRNAFAACTTVLDASPAKASPASYIGAIIDDLPPASRMYHTEALAQALSLHALPERGWWTHLLSLDAMVHSIETLEADSLIADQGEPSRSDAVRRNDARGRRSLNPLMREGTPLAVFIKRDEELRDRLRFLQQLAEISATQKQTGKWPEPKPPLILQVDAANPLHAVLKSPQVPTFSMDTKTTGPIEASVHGWAGPGTDHGLGDLRSERAIKGTFDDRSPCTGSIRVHEMGCRVNEGEGLLPPDDVLGCDQKMYLCGSAVVCSCPSRGIGPTGRDNLIKRDSHR